MRVARRQRNLRMPWNLAAVQGIETVRRDNCLLVRDVITTSLEKMLIEKDVDGAVAYVKGMISNLLMNRIDLSLLVITKVTAAWLWALLATSQPYGLGQWLCTLASWH